MGTSGTDILKSIGTLAASVTDVETVIGSTGTADRVTMLDAGALAVSAIETAIGTGGGTEIVTLLASGSLRTTNIETVVGTTGSDVFVFSGGQGVTAYGGTGADTYTGGTGADVFVFSSTADSATGGGDTITNFDKGASGIDVLDFSAITGGSGTLQTNGTTYNTGGAGAQAIVRTSGLLEVDTDGNGTTDIEIHLSCVGVNGLHSGDITW